MAARTLRHTLVVRHPETSEATALVAGTEVPEWADDLVHDDDTEKSAATAKGSRSSKSTQGDK